MVKLPTEIPGELLRRSSRARVPQFVKDASDSVDQISGNKISQNQTENEPNKRFKLKIKLAIRPKTRHESPTPTQEEGKQQKTTVIKKRKTKSSDKDTIDLKPLVADGFLDIDEDELDLERTLLGGQSFRWAKTQHLDSAVFTGVVQDSALKLWRPDEHRVAFKKLTAQPENVSNLLTDYFQLKYKLKDLYEEWCQRDERLKECCPKYKGFRILRQDPVENLFSFICASNNNIKRITSMIEKLCQRFGETLQTETDSPLYKSFPTVERLAENDVEDILRRELGFGYRAKFIHSTAQQLLSLSQVNECKSPRDYLLSLRNKTYKETCSKLQSFDGIGRKIADCICLMSMDHLNSVPVDCHMYEVVCRDYLKNLKDEHKYLTDTVHDKIRNYFNNLHGPLAGWSSSILFIAELKHLKQKTED